MEKNVLCVKNRDARQQYLAQMLLEDGCQVTLCEEKCRELGEYELVLLPVVTAKLDLKQMICQLQKGQRVFGGNLPEFFQDACMEKGVSCYDYMEEETIAVKNAVATAEGAIAEAICFSEETLYGAKVLVTGYGRCGRVLADRLCGMRCEVTVLEQEPEKRAIAEISGCHSVQNIEEILTEHTAGEYRFLFHTIPVMIWKEAALKELPVGMTIIDIASGGAAWIMTTVSATVSGQNSVRGFRENMHQRHRQKFCMNISQSNADRRSKWRWKKAVK